MGGVTVLVTGVVGTGQVAGVLIWSEIDTTQTPNWANITTTQTPNWTNVPA